jgi:O-antigen/teichoic acid export membrane protein
MPGSTTSMLPSTVAPGCMSPSSEPLASSSNFLPHGSRTPIVTSAGGRVWLGTFATNAAILGCGTATGILTARLLQPEGRGVVAAVIFWPALLAGVGLLSLNESITYCVSLPGADRHRVLSAGFWTALALGLATAAICWFLLPVLLGSRYETWLWPARAFALVFLPANFLALSINAIMHGELRFGRLNLMRLLVSLLYLGALCAIWAAGLVTVEYIVAATALSTLMAGLLNIASIWRRLRIPRREDVRVLLRTGLSFHATALLAFIAGQADRFVAIRALDSASVGMYAVAVTVSASGLAIVTSTFHSVMFPMIARQDSGAQRMYLGKGLRYAMLITVVGAVPLIAGSPWLIPALFGREFQGSVAPAMILAAAYVPLALRQITARNLRGLGLSRAGAVSEALAIVVFAAAVWPLVSALRLNGIAVALLISNTVSLTYLVAYLHSRLGFRLADWWGLDPRTVVDLMHRTRGAHGLA